MLAGGSASWPGLSATVTQHTSFPVQWLQSVSSGCEIGDGGAAETDGP